MALRVQGSEPPDFVIAAGARLAGEWTLENFVVPKLLDPQGRALSLDFDHNKSDYNRRQHRGRKEILVRALTGGSEPARVLDMSTGLAIDAVFLCQMGFEVTALERNPILFYLLQSAWQRSQRPELKRLHLRLTDAQNFLSEDLSGFQAIYFDPMYPVKKKSALPRQEMLVFRELVGDDSDSAQALQLARERFRGRIVVKRPLKAEALLPGVTHSFRGKIVRYDLYMR
ncbi:MAG: class I SAM-dependent methyltransferase [Bdellovibrionaceae bacterium]|nr:class I SAM-dependent methyltransferase [Pseudobdellovibrionaceae bacterium]